jgi:hypothetical protein
MYEGVSKSFRTESITKYTFTTINTRSEAIQSVMAAKLTRLTHKIAIQLHLVPESYTICSSRSRQPVRKLLDTPSYVRVFMKPFDGPMSPPASHRFIVNSESEASCLQENTPHLRYKVSWLMFRETVAVYCEA